MSLSQIESLSVFGLKEDPIASINKDQQVATDQEGKCKGVLHRPCFIPQLAFGAGVSVVCSSCRLVLFSFEAEVQIIASSRGFKRSDLYTPYLALHVS